MTRRQNFGFLEAAGRTDIGRRRANNEDALLMLLETGIFCVADGIGGGEGGEIASHHAIEAIRHEFTERHQHTDNMYDRSQQVVRALNRASKWIYEQGPGGDGKGAGTTVVAMVFGFAPPQRAMVLHAGDSRAYLFRDQVLEPVTTDHSLAAAAGFPDENDVPVMFQGVITRAVGIYPRVQVELTPVAIQEGDIFLLCTDGLTRMLSDAEIQKILRKHGRGGLQAAVHLLINTANHAGGDDNITTVLIRIGKLEDYSQT